jgi:hypothetical protein
MSTREGRPLHQAPDAPNAPEEPDVPLIYEIAFDAILQQIRSRRARRDGATSDPPPPESRPIVRTVSRARAAKAPSDPPLQTYPMIVLDL